jgi:hypothetical protein
MVLTSSIREHMEVIGADGVHVGTIDKVEGHRLKLTKADGAQGAPAGSHHYLSVGLVAAVEGNRVRLSTNSDNAFMLQTEQDQGSTKLVTTQAPEAPTKPVSPKPPEAPTKLATPRAPEAPTKPITPQVPEASTTLSTPRAPEAKPAVQKPRSKASSSWAAPALGVLAASAIGAAFLARGRKSETQKFELQLQTDENIRLISSKKVEGTPVVGQDGERLGQIESFMVDKYSGRVAYAVLAFGGAMGMGESLLPLPWSYLTYDEAKNGYSLNITSEQLENAPKFKPSEAPEFDLDYRRNLHQFHAG